MDWLQNLGSKTLDYQPTGVLAIAIMWDFFHKLTSKYHTNISTQIYTLTHTYTLTHILFPQCKTAYSSKFAGLQFYQPVPLLFMLDYAKSQV